LPFVVQNMISKNILSFLKPAPTDYLDTETGEKVFAKDITEWSDMEKLAYGMYDGYKIAEYAMYKDFHRIVLNDDGCPALKKSAFRMPGYRKVLGKDEREYEIDNKLKLEKQVTEVGAGLIVPEEVVDSDLSHEDNSGDNLQDNVSDLNSPRWRKK
jgi:hypothetical protein